MSAPFNGLLFGAELLFIPMALAGYVALTADTMRRVIAAQLAGSLAALQLVLLSAVFSSPSFAELGQAVALLAIGGGLLFAHFLDRWI